MNDEQVEVLVGDGFAVGNLEGMGSGPGFRKVRKQLDVQEFGVNAIVMPPGISSGRHWHDEQEELYFVHQGTIEIFIGMEGEESFVLGPGGLARVDAGTVRRIANAGEVDAVYVVVGAKGGYVGRDGNSPEGEQRAAAAN